MKPTRLTVALTMCLLACALGAQAAPPPVRVFDATDGWSPSAPNEGKVAEIERGAEAVDFQGNAVIANGRIAVMVVRDAVELYAVDPDGTSHKEVSIGLLGEDGKPLGAVKKVELDGFDRGRAAVRLTFENGEAAVAVKRGESLVECTPGRGVQTMLLTGQLRWCMLPAFLGDDVLFVPEEHKPGRHFLPSENLLLFFMQREGALVQAIWPPGDQMVEMVVAEGDDGRSLQAARIGFEGKPLYLAAWHRPGLWTAGKVTDRFGSRGGKLGDVKLSWQMPFAAQWKTVFHSPGRDTSWDKQVGMKKGTIGAHGGRSIEYVCPFYSKGKTAFLRLPPEGIHPEQPELYVTFALRREKGTPADVQLPEDVLRMSLNTGVCEYLLGSQGMGTLGRPGGPLCVLDRRFGILARLYENKPIPSQLLDVQVDWILEQGVQQVERTHQYIAFAADVKAAVEKFTGKSAGLDDSLRSIAAKARDVDVLARDIPVKMMQRLEGQTDYVPAGDDPVTVMNDLVARLKAALKTRHVQNAAEWEDLESKLHGVAVAPQALLPDPRRLTRLIQYEAGRLAEHGPDGVRASREIRKLAAKMLRGRHWAEMGR